MYPAIASEDRHPNAKFFSSCSLESISAVIACKGGCLEEPHSCFQSGACCLGQHLLPAGSPCNILSESDACMHRPLCDGMNSSCPLPMMKPDGAFCSNDQHDHGICHQGRCQLPHVEACARLDLDPCILPQAPCVVACMDSSFDDPACVALASACKLDASPPIGSSVWWENRDDCPLLPEENPCRQDDGALGVCASGMCQVCNRTCQEQLSMDVKRVNCSISTASSSVCSEPCGGGRQVSRKESVVNCGF